MKRKVIVQNGNPPTWLRDLFGHGRVASLLAGIALLTTSGAQAASTWTGLGADSNWSTGNNWSGSAVPSFPTDLIFAGSTRLVNNNDISGVSASSITFDSAAGAFTLNGNALGLNGNISFNGVPASPVTQTINLPLTPSGNVLATTSTNGNITINGNITGANTELTQQSAGNAGILTLAGTNALKGLVINNSTNRITGNTTVTGIGGSSFFYLADAQTTRIATLIIEPGANLTVSGPFQDAAVIGRDGGSGTIIQNGGTFNFNINDGSHEFLFIGASGNSATRSSYNMNGGVLDMNGKTLGVALGANTVITGLLNQASGVITNVGTLSFSPFFVQGYGIYNLTGGSIYIGSGGIVAFAGSSYELNLGGGTIGALSSWSSALNLKLTGSNGPVIFNPAGNAIALSGILSGPGGLTVAGGGGTLDLSGANTYTGDTTVNGGSTLQLDTTGSSTGAFKLANGAILILNFNGNYAVGSLYTNGVSLPVGTYNANNLPAFITGPGNIQVSSGISSGTWTGSGANNNWSTPGNWDNNAVPIFPHAVTFAGNSRLANNNDLSAITVTGLTFDSAAGAFVLSGNDITLNGGIGFNGNPAAPITQTVNFGLTLVANQTLNLPTNGNLALNGNITTSSGFTKAGAGTLTLGGANDSLTSLVITGGTNVITGNVTVAGTGGNSRFYVGDIGSVGNLLIQTGATLNVTGNFGDAGVIGRDSGSGSIVQNGGTFTFNPANAAYLFVGASSSAATKAEYDMNGGTLDMNNYTLAVALSANGGTVITGIVNQTGGTMNNVGQLDLGAFTFGPGHGIYKLTGGSIYLGGLGGIGIRSESGSYEIYLGGGTVGAYSPWNSPLNMTLTGSNGPVSFDTAGTSISLSGILSGPGGLAVTGGGVLELSGANTYSGDTIVNSGILQLDNTGSSSGALRLTNNATLNLNFNGNYAVGRFYTNGVILPNGTYNAGNLPAFIIGSGNLLVSGGISTGIWDGGGANNNWSTGANWDNDVVPIFPIALTFTGNSRLANNNDLTGATAASITFDSAAGAFVLGGNPLGLNGNIGFNGNPATPVTQRINMDLTLNANETVNTPTNGNIILGGAVTTGSGFVKAGAGTLTLAGTDSLTALTVNGGTNIITGNVTVTGTGGKFYLADGGNQKGSLVIQPGAALTVLGSYGDAAVIGRDSGSGTVIQNGGTFTYNPDNQSYIFVGATSNPGTRSEYDMNAGVFDLSGKTLGVALADQGVSSTGIVNQVGGVITNLNQLWLSSVFASGYGIYNLTGGAISIGTGGITASGGYQINLGGGTIGAQGNWSSSLGMILTGINGSVTFSPAGNIITLSGALSGSGGLAVTGGTLELSGANTYTGDTVVNASGTLQLDTTRTTTGAFRVANGGLLNLNYTGTYSVGSLYTNGVALPTGTYNAGNLSAFILGTGNLQVTGSLPTTPTNLTFSASNGHLTISWPANYQGWILQQQTNSLSATNWTDVSGTAGVTSTNITINPAIPHVFYRLRYPTP